MNQVKLISNDKSLKISVNDRIDTNNAGLIEKEIEEIINNQNFEKLVLNFSNLDYISSAGIRILIKLAKSYDLSLENVPVEIEEILNSTGLDTVIPIQRKLREFSTKGLEKISAGYNGAVYRLDQETILKAICNIHSLDEIKRERESSQKAFLMGIPSAISFDIVKVGEQYGIVYELLALTSLNKELANHTERIETLGKEIRRLGKEIAGNRVDDTEFIDKKEELIKEFSSIEDTLPEDLKESIFKILSSIPESSQFVHGDFHPGNIIMIKNEMSLIDFSNTGKGHPIFDILSFPTTSVGTVIGHPDEYVSFFNSLTKEQNYQLWDAYLKGFLGTEDTEILDQVKTMLIPLNFIRIILSLAGRIKLGKEAEKLTGDTLNKENNIYDLKRNKMNLKQQIEIFNKVKDQFNPDLFKIIDEQLDKNLG